MVEEIRSMWCDTLEELLQCPICLEVREGSKVQCTNGHHICTQCKSQLAVCPMCKSYFINTRNLAVEQLSAKLKEIKLSLLHPYHALNRRILENKVCIATQTENADISLMSSSSQTDNTITVNSIVKNEQQKQIILSPKVGRGVYPCRIGLCKSELPHGRIIGHLRYYHSNVFQEIKNGCTTFKHSWNLEYALNKNYDFALYIKGMGLFFFNVSIHQKGLMACVQIVNCHNASKLFTYTLETGRGFHKICYTGAVKSCRARKEHLSKDCLHVRDDNMHRIIDSKDNKKLFHCNLMIDRRVDQNTATQNNPIPLLEV